MHALQQAQCEWGAYFHTRPPWTVDYQRTMKNLFSEQSICTLICHFKFLSLTFNFLQEGEGDE